MDETVRSLADRLHRERELRGWPLSELARRAAVSRSMISKVERGEASPTATLLGRLAGAFGTTMSSLLAGPAGPQRLIRRNQQSLWKDPASGYLRRTVCPPGAGPVSYTHLTLPTTPYV